MTAVSYEKLMWLVGELCQRLPEGTTITADRIDPDDARSYRIEHWVRDEDGLYTSQGNIATGNRKDCYRACELVLYGLCLQRPGFAFTTPAVSGVSS